MKEKTTYPITGHVEVVGFGRVPVLGVCMMSNEREKELAAKSAKRWKEAQGA